MYTAAVKHSLLTSGLRSYCVQLVVNRTPIDTFLLQQFGLQQRYVAVSEVDENRAGDVLTFVSAHRYHRRQTPLQFTYSVNAYAPA